MKRLAGTFLLVLGLCLIVGIGSQISHRYGPIPTVLANEEDIVAFYPTETSIRPIPLPTPVASKTPTALSQDSNEIATSTPTPTPLPLYWYDGLQLDESEVTSILISMRESTDEILLGPFTTHAWYDGIFSTDLFWDADNPSGIIWAGLNGFYGIWLHSGTDRPASLLQEYIERNASGSFRTVEEANAIIDNSIVGSTARIVRNGELSVNLIVAGIRIGTDGVIASIQHAVDLPQYIEETYPGHGFGNMDHTMLIIYFCGRRLAGEPDEPSATYWQKARFVFMAVPEDRASEYLNPEIYLDGESIMDATR